MVVLVQQIINGLGVGAVYALLSVGFSVAFGILRMVNFAHGEIIIFGGFIAYTLNVLLGINLLVAIVVGVIASGFLAIIVERLAIKPLRLADPVIALLTTIGASMVLRTIVESIWKTKALPFPTIGAAQAVEIAGIRFPTMNFVALGVSVLVLLAFRYFLQYHKQGKAIRCLAQNVSVAALVGIPVDRTISLVYGLGGILGGIGAALWCGTYGVIITSLGFVALMKAFVISLVGGQGNLIGTIVVAIVLGLIESLVGGFISSAYRDVIAYGILIIILIFKPSGLFGTRIAERI